MSETWALDDNGDPIPGTGMRWEGPERCGEEVFMAGQCIGPEGHEGKHFCYNDTGCYCWDDPDKTDGIAAGQTPAGHEDWPHPVDVYEKTWVGLGGWHEIDPSEGVPDD